jgi:hypothetical protein
MNQRFAVLTEGSKPKIYKLPVNQTARLINEIPDRKVDIFETLNGAREAALTLVNLAKEQTRPSIATFSTQPNPEDEKFLRMLSELTEDRVENYYF